MENVVHCLFKEFGNAVFCNPNFERFHTENMVQKENMGWNKLSLLFIIISLIHIMKLVF